MHPIVPPELQVHLGMGSARHDGLRERIEVDRNVVSIGLRLGQHAAEQLYEEEMDVRHFELREGIEYCCSGHKYERAT